jgi:hypothetical protein
MGAGDWVFVGDPQRLVRGAPRLKTRLAGADAVDLPLLQADYARPFVPVLFACLSRGPTTASPSLTVLGRPAGTDEFSLTLVATGAAPFLTMDDGTLSAVYLTTNTTAIDGLRFGIGPAENVDPAHLDIGQLLAAECFEFRASREWSEHRENLSAPNLTKTGQPFPDGEGVSLRVANVSVTPVGFGRTIGTGDTLQALQASLANSRPVLCVPMPRGVGRGRSAPIDQEAVARSALFGYCDSLGTIQMVPQSNLFQLALRFREAPGTPV